MGHAPNNTRRMHLPAAVTHLQDDARVNFVDEDDGAAPILALLLCQVKRITDHLHVT